MGVNFRRSGTNIPCVSILSISPSPLFSFPFLPLPIDHYHNHAANGREKAEISRLFLFYFNPSLALLPFRLLSFPPSITITSRTSVHAANEAKNDRGRDEGARVLLNLSHLVLASPRLAAPSHPSLPSLSFPFPSAPSLSSLGATRLLIMACWR